MMHRASWALILLGCAPAAEPDPYSGFRIGHCLETAADLQRMDPTARAEALRSLAKDPRRAWDLFPLCRMLFRAKEKGVFRAPRLGAPVFVGTSEDRPLQPIALHEGMPILIVRGYDLGGVPEAPESYLAYCLSECAWRETAYAPADAEQRRRVVVSFLGTHSMTLHEAEWIRRQAE